MATSDQGPVLHQTYVECDACEEDIEVEWYCLSCKSNLCGSCKTARLHRKHIIKPWMDPEAVSARQDAPMPCNIHPDKTYVNYCTDCDVLCCATCNAGDHNGHHSKTIEEVFDEKRTSLRKFMEELRGLCMNMATEYKDTLVKRREVCRSQCSENKEKIKEKIDSLRTDLSSMEKSLMTEEDERNIVIEANINGKISNVERIENKIKQTVKEIEYEISISNRQSIIQKSLSSLSLEGYKVQDLQSLLPFHGEFEKSNFKFPSSKETVGSKKQNLSCIRLVLLGVTGVGKSALGNTILRKKRFISRCSSDSTTNRCESAEEDVNGIKVQVVDTPGAAMSVISVLPPPGPHAFLIVLNPNRFIASDRHCLKDIEAMLGAEVLYKYAMVVFTRKQDIYAYIDCQSIHEFVRAGCCDEIQQFISKCNNRVIAVENLGSKDAESERVLNFVGDLIQNNNYSYYKSA